MRKSTVYIFLFVFSFSLPVFAQPGSTIDIPKPEKYEKRKLGSEKTGEKKFTFSRHLIQNAFTHYNYYFNANNKLNEIIQQAKTSFIDDYTKLLPFYNYRLNETAGNSQIDSIIYECNAGILLHDLRNDWIDNMYLLLGQAYFYKKNFDSADQVFRYINYAFAPKEEGGYDIPVGSNISNSDAVFSVATKENNSFPKKLITTPPSRNDALLWQAKSFIETERYGEAAGIMEILRNDPVFPERLNAELNEALAYWFYKQQVYDSAANYLVKALGVAGDKTDKARMEFLIAQMYEVSDSSDKAIVWFSKSATDATNPIMEVYANLNSIKAAGSASEKIINEKLNNLLKMARRDKYFSHRDIIYYAIAQVELENKDFDVAEKMLGKSIQYNMEDNPDQRSKAFMLLADVKYERQQYIASKNYYDSVNASSLANEIDKNRLNIRSPALTIVADNLLAIHEEDSLQTIAKLPKDQRDAQVKKMVRFLRRQKGLKDEPLELTTNPAVQEQTVTDLFNSGSSNSEWYFNNLSLKSAGFNQFRAKWGNRPNTDNWQRLEAQQKMIATNLPDMDGKNGNQEQIRKLRGINRGLNTPTNANQEEIPEISFNSLYANLPLTDEQISESNNKIADALFRIGEAFQDKLENYISAINNYEELLKKYSSNRNVEQSLYNLYYCYNKVGRTSSADSALAVLKRNFPNGALITKLTQSPVKGSADDNPATIKYKEIYNLFIQGKFEEAKIEKARADSVYGNSYWTPQLLYIESIYYVANRDDSTAISRLGNISTLYPKTSLAEKAATMIDVLRRRSEIEKYLTNLQITRYPDDTATQVVDLTSVKPTIQKVEVENDSLVSNPVKQTAKTQVDSSQKAPATIKSFEFNAKDQQYVVILLDKVDPVYINEARNAFNRYNQITFYDQKIDLIPVKLDERYNLVLIGPFSDAVSAVNYVDKTKPVTTTRIIPWLTADKYSYAIISESNLSLLKDTKDVEGYKNLLEKVLPGKF